MSDFFSMLKCVFVCGTVIFITCVILLSLPRCKLRYVGLECTKYAVVAGLLILVALPIDLLPGLPLDDIGYLIGAYWAGASALQDRSERREIEDAENALYAQCLREATEQAQTQESNRMTAAQE
jgi:hypothetical protein